jgi:hypothetical protein
MYTGSSDLTTGLHKPMIHLLLEWNLTFLLDTKIQLQCKTYRHHKMLVQLRVQVIILCVVMKGRIATAQCTARAAFWPMLLNPLGIWKICWKTLTAVHSGKIQWVKKLSQCLAVLERLAWHKSSKLRNNLKIIYVVLGYLSFQISFNARDLEQNWWNAR